MLTLSAQGHVPASGTYRDRALYDVDALRQLGTTSGGTAIVTGVVADRIAWLESSVTTEDAARWLDWDRRDFERVAKEQGLTQGRFARWAREDIAGAGR